MKTKLLCGLIASLALCGVARSSELLTYLASTSLEMTGSPTPLELPGFNPAFGSLTGVKLSYWGQVEQTWMVENTGSSVPLDYALSSTANLTLTKSSGGSALFASPLDHFSHTQGGSITSPFDDGYDFDGASGFTFVRNTSWIAPAPYQDGNLASYLTSGNIGFTSLATSIDGISFTAGNGISGAFTMASATLQVEYTYSLIPEPSTYAAWLGIVVLGAAVLRRRVRLTA